MANPFMGVSNNSAPPQVGNPVGDGSLYNVSIHVALLLVFALTILVALKVSGFRAMVGIGRG